MMKRHLGVIVVVVVILVAGAFLAFYLHSQVKRQVLSQFSESQLLVARETARHLEAYLEARSEDVRHLASLDSLQRLDAARMAADLRSAAERLKAVHVTGIVVIGTDWRVIVSTPEGAAGAKSANSEAYAWAKDPTSRGVVRLTIDRPDAGGAASGDEPPDAQLSLSTPLYGPAAGDRQPGPAPTFQGALLLRINLSALAGQSFARSPASAVPNQPSTWVMAADGTLLLQPDHPEMVLRNIRQASSDCYQCHASFDYAERMLLAKQGTVDYQLIGQAERIAAFAPMTVENASWIVVVNAPKDDVTRFIRTNFYETMGLLGAVGLVVGLVFAVVQRNARQEIVIAQKARHLEEKEVLLHKLREASEYLDNLFTFANAPIVVWDPQLRITRFNHACERLTGYAADEVIGRGLRMLFPDEGREGSLGKVIEALDDLSRESPEIPIRRKDGSIRIVLWNAANIHSGDGAAVIATIAQGQDITVRKQAEQMKADFVSFVSHQLRTPLSGIRWLLELAQQEALPEEAGSFISDARTSTERLVTLVNDLLAVSRIEGGRIDVHPQPLDLAALTADVAGDLEPLAREKRLHLAVPPVGAEPLAYADPKLAREVLLNLLSNAIKYTPEEGSVAVSLSVDGGLLRWTVRDSGIGVPIDAQPHLFEKFYRGKNATSVDTEGSGLGLYLARLIVERSGGRVWYEAGAGSGSTFAFTLPLAGVTAPPA